MAPATHGGPGGPGARAAVRVLTGVTLLLLVVPAASAATFRYASSSNRIYVENGGSATLTQIKAAIPDAPLDNLGGGTWLLRANIQIEDGSALVLHGTPIGGDVNELRLKSDGSGHVQVTADHGTIDIGSTRITSWDGDGPDTNYADGRAFVRVRSKLHGDGVTPLESRMDVVDSDIGYLGFDDAESYGLVWKVNGPVPAVLAQVEVRGNIINSRLHHNYFGMYSFGHQGGVWRDNQVDHNVQYGFDPHDDSDNLVIENNDVHDNGNHGIIASKRCHNVVIRGNRTWNNAGNGIMLHRSSNDSLIEDNESWNNEDSGIALFANARTVVRNNRLTDNGMYGIRLSMGSEDNRIEDNVIDGAGKYGIYFYRGSDTPEPGSDGRNRRNVFIGNTIRNVVAEGIKMTDSDDNRFEGNQFSAVGPVMRFTTSAGTRFTGNTLPSTVTLTLSGSASVPTDIRIWNQARVLLSFDSNSRAIFSDAGNAIFDPDEAVYTAAATDGSTLTLDEALTGGTTRVYTRKLYATPASGSVQVNPTSWKVGADTSKTFKARFASTSQQVTFRVGDLAPGTTYRVLQGSVQKGTFVADATGHIAFTLAAGTTSTVTYYVRPM